MRIEIVKSSGETCQIIMTVDFIEGIVYQSNQDDCDSVFYAKRGTGNDMQEFLVKVEMETGIKFYKE